MNLKQICTLISCVTLFSGCAVFKGGNVPITSLNTVNGNSQKLSVDYSIRARGGLGTPVDLIPMQQRIIEDEFVQVLNNSFFFAHVSSHNPNADLKLSVTMTNSGNPAALIPAFITGLSLLTIPSWATDNFNVEVIATTKNAQRRYTLNDSTTLVQWLPMIFVFPFNNFSNIPEVRKNMYANVLIQMQRDGLLTSAESTECLAKDLAHNTKEPVAAIGSDSNTKEPVAAIGLERNKDSSPEERLMTLKKLNEQNLISPEEYEKKKSEIISTL